MAKSKKSTAKQEIPKEKLLHMHKLMCDIRNFDEKVNYMVKRGQVPGMTHFSVGEEAANVWVQLLLCRKVI